MWKVQIILAIAFTPFATLYRLNDDSSMEIDGIANKNSTISLDQFKILRLLGSGTYSNVYLAQKIGGSDDDKMYALKAMNITHLLFKERQHKRDFIIHEREILETIKGLPWMTELHYAWNEGIWLFLVTDLVCGEPILYQLSPQLDAATMKLMLAEIVLAYETLHSVNIFHHDFSFLNLLGDSEGHLKMIDFGWSERFVDTTEDWQWMARDFRTIFTAIIKDKDADSLVEVLNKTTDATLPELKRHAYFDEINWTEVAERKCRPPFKVTEFPLEMDDTLDLVQLIIGIAEEIGPDVAERLRNYTYVAPEHQL